MCPFLQCFALRRDVLSQCNGCSPHDAMWRDQDLSPGSRLQSSSQSWKEKYLWFSFIVFSPLDLILRDSLRPVLWIDCRARDKMQKPWLFSAKHWTITPLGQAMNKLEKPLSFWAWLIDLKLQPGARWRTYTLLLFMFAYVQVLLSGSLSAACFQGADRYTATLFD